MLSEGLFFWSRCNKEILSVVRLLKVLLVILLLLLFSFNEMRRKERPSHDQRITAISYLFADNIVCPGVGS